MRKITLIMLMIALTMITGCKDTQKNLYLPKAKNDKIYSSVGSDKHHGEGYTLTVPQKSYRYEKDFDDGNLEEKWEYKRKDDVAIKVITYKNTDEITARGKFLNDNDDYVFEDLMGYSVCGTEPDGDTLWFNLHEADGTVYIVSWEYPRNTKEDLKKELSDIAETFKLDD